MIPTTIAQRITRLERAASPEAVVANEYADIDEDMRIVMYGGTARLLGKPPRGPSRTEAQLREIAEDRNNRRNARIAQFLLKVGFYVGGKRARAYPATIKE
jgi:hypothetical protein